MISRFVLTENYRKKCEWKKNRNTKEKNSQSVRWREKKKFFFSKIYRICIRFPTSPSRFDFSKQVGIFSLDSIVHATRFIHCYGLADYFCFCTCPLSLPLWRRLFSNHWVSFEFSKSLRRLVWVSGRTADAFDHIIRIMYLCAIGAV